MEELSEDVNYDSKAPTGEEVGILCLNVPDRRPPRVGDFSITSRPALQSQQNFMAAHWLPCPHPRRLLLLYSHLLRTWVSLAACSLLWEFIRPIVLGYQP